MGRQKSIENAPFDFLNSVFIRQCEKIGSFLRWVTGRWAKKVALLNRRAHKLALVVLMASPETPRRSRGNDPGGLSVIKGWRFQTCQHRWRRSKITAVFASNIADDCWAMLLFLLGGLIRFDFVPGFYQRPVFVLGVVDGVVGQKRPLLPHPPACFEKQMLT